jgi:hypothetical protein
VQGECAKTVCLAGSARIHLFGDRTSGLRLGTVTTEPARGDTDRARLVTRMGADTHR